MVKTLGTKVEDDIYEVFRLACEREGVTVSDRLRDMVNELVKEEAPFLLIDPQVCNCLKGIAERKGVEWRKLTCDIILSFCEQQAKTEKGEEGKEAPTEEKKPKRSIVSILKGENEEEARETVTVIHPDGSKEKVPKDRIRIFKESVFKKEGSTEEKKPEDEGSIEEKLKGFEIERE